MRLDPDTEYLTTQGVAEYIGVKVSSIYVYLSTGRMPEPDAIYLNRSLWLVSTIDAWRKNRYKHGKANVPRRVKVKQRARVRPHPPKLASVQEAKKGKRITPPPGTRKTAPKVEASGRKYEEQSTPWSAVSEPIARQIAAALRADGFACTTSDVMKLSLYEGELEHERFLLQQRIRAKIRGLKQQRL